MHKNVKGSDATAFIPISLVPKYKNVDYANMICDHRPLKTENYRMRLTLDGDVLVYT